MHRAAGIVTAVLLAACGAAADPHRFMSPMLAGADVDVAGPRPRANRRERPDPLPPEQIVVAHHVRTAAPIRVASAGPPPAAVASGAAALDPGVIPPNLPAPHQLPADAPLPPIATPAALRALVGRRDARAPLTAALAWWAALHHVDVPDARTGAELLAWAAARDRLADRAATAAPGDLLVFDRVEGAPADLVAVVIARDARGVTEYAYLGAGVVRRGFLDVARPALRRDSTGAVVNTFLRNGSRWPPSGTHYLAGELLAHVIR